jgi:hypothetical protein
MARISSRPKDVDLCCRRGRGGGQWLAEIHHQPAVESPVQSFRAHQQSLLQAGKRRRAVAGWVPSSACCSEPSSSFPYASTISVAGGEETAGGGWLGSITSLLLRALFNVSVRINNLVVKYLAPTSVATLTCQSIHVHTALDGWQANLSVCLSSLSFSLHTTEHAQIRL